MKKIWISKFEKYNLNSASRSIKSLRDAKLHALRRIHFILPPEIDRNQTHFNASPWCVEWQSKLYSIFPPLLTQPRKLCVFFPSRANRNNDKINDISSRNRPRNAFLHHRQSVFYSPRLARWPRRWQDDVICVIEFPVWSDTTIPYSTRRKLHVSKTYYTHRRW